MHRSLFLVAAITCGCSYPEFGFDEQPPIDSALADAATDALPIDTALTDSLPIDTAPVDTGPRGCTGSTAVFCIDFSKSIEPHDGWSGSRLAPTGTLTLENTAPHSAPNNLFASTKSALTDYIDANVYKSLTAPALDRDARIEVWMKLPAKPTGSGKFFLVRYQRAGAGDGISLEIDATGFFLEVFGGAYAQRRTSIAVPIDRWFQVRIDARLKYVGGEARVWIDDMTTPAMEATALSTLETDSLGRQLTVGIFASEAASDFAARFDDVSFNWK